MPDSGFSRVKKMMFMIIQLQITKEPSEVNGHVVPTVRDQYDTNKHFSLLVSLPAKSRSGLRGRFTDFFLCAARRVDRLMH